MPQYKILYTLNQARIAGTEQHLLTLLDHLRRDLFSPYVVCFSEGPLVSFLNHVGITAFAFPRKAVVDFSAGRRLLHFIREQRFDLLHSHCGQYSCLIGKLAGIPHLIETRHGLYFNYDELNHVGPVSRFVNRWKASFVDLTLTVCETDKKLLMDRFHVPEEKMRAVLNGIEAESLDQLCRDQESFARDMNLSGNSPIVGTVARFAEQKGLAYLIQAIPLVLRQLPQARFLIVGDGELREHLLNLTRKLQICESITFLGYRKDACKIISTFDVFVLPSLWEGLPYTILEAMALKRPVVTTNVFGNVETVIDGETGYLVPPRDADALAAAILKLLKDPDQAAEMGRRGHNRVSTHFSAHTMTRKIEEIYLELLNGK